MMRDVMLDFETFGGGGNACVVQVGACFFDRETGEIGKTFKRNVDARTAVENGATMDADTIYWWMAQAPEAIASVTATPAFSLEQVFAELNLFLADVEAIWSHLSFDWVILETTLKRLRIKPLFRYKAARDIRTLNDLAKIDFSNYERVGTHHDALDDCLFQVKYCVGALNHLKGKQS